MSDHSQPAIIEGEVTGSSVVPYKDPPFKWTTARQRACSMLACGNFTLRDVAAKLGMSEALLHKYKHHPVFSRRLSELEQEAQERMVTATVARKQKRVELIESLLLDALTLRQERGEKMAVSKIDKDVPGVSTGMVARLEKVIGAGQAARLVREYRWDSDLEVAIERLLKAGKEEFSGVEHDSDSGIKRLYVGINIDAV